MRGEKVPIWLYLRHIRMDKKKFGKGVDTSFLYTIPCSLEHIHHNSMVQSASETIYEIQRKNH